MLFQIHNWETIFLKILEKHSCETDLTQHAFVQAGQHPGEHPTTRNNALLFITFYENSDVCLW